MVEFFKCPKCRNEFLIPGPAPTVTRCDRCGTQVYAEGKAPREYVADDGSWNCNKCGKDYDGPQGTNYSKCPHCGHVNKSWRVQEESPPPNRAFDEFLKREQEKSGSGCAVLLAALLPLMAGLAAALFIGT